MKETDNVYPGVDGKEFEVILDNSFKGGDRFYYTSQCKLRVTREPKLTRWSRVKKFFGFEKNLIYITKVEVVKNENQ